MSEHRHRSAATGILLLLLLGCLVMACVDALWNQPYLIKSAVKAVFFLVLPILFATLHRDLSVRGLFHVDRRDLGPYLLAGGIVFCVILGGYALLCPWLDLTRVTTMLATENIDRQSFPFVAIYIAVCNSFMEEFFFRGFSFLTLRRFLPSKCASFVSASAFALYHVAIVIGWFPLPLFLLVIAALFITGIVFNALDARHGTTFPSWMLHMCANLAINSIGLLLFHMPA